MPQKTKTKETGVGILVPIGTPGQQIIDLQHIAARQTTEALKAELARLLGFSAENLLRLAVVVAELEKRGEDLSNIRMGLLPILRKIAIGELLPEIVVLYAGQPAAIDKVAKMPVEEQQRVARGDLLVDVSQPHRPCTYQRRENYSGKVVGRQGFQGPKEPEESRASRAPNLLAIALNASAKDVADMAADLILKCTEPKIAVAQFLVRLGIPASLAELVEKSMKTEVRKSRWDD